MNRPHPLTLYLFSNDKDVQNMGKLIIITEKKFSYN
jgi:hypothetical protein